MTTTRSAYRTCPLCEATCGLEIAIADERVVRIRGDREDVLSKGFICPKGSALKQLHEDPDRLRTPHVKRNGVHVPVSWAEAWREVERGLLGVIERTGRESLGVFLGNPNAHNLSALLYNRVWLRALGTRHLYSASTVDQIPKQVASGWMFGTPLSVAIPDVDRTQYLLMLGANPYESNGSLCTAPDFPARMDAIRKRGGKVVVVDPRLSATAKAADEWIAIRPGTDGLLLAAIANEIIVSNSVDVGDHLREHVVGVEALKAALAPFTPARVASATGVSAAVIERLAAELVAAASAAVYGRIGTTTVAFGTTTSWLVDVVNTLTGNLDRPGGVMFPLPAAGSPNTKGVRGRGTGFVTGRGRSRVRGFPEALGELPVSLLAEEITTPGAGQIRALVTFAGNPVLSTPNASQIDKALETLEFMVSIDLYLNETTRHADVILPPPSHLERSHFDVSFAMFAVRNVANYSPAVFERDPTQPDEWEILATIAGIAQGLGADVDPARIDEATIGHMVHSMVRDAHSPIFGRDEQAILTMLDSSGRRGVDRMLDLLVRTGPYGDAFGTIGEGLTLDALIAHPHGIDFGPLQPRIPEMLRTPTGAVELAPTPLIEDLQRLESSIDEVDNDQLLLIGRRHLRSNNSWMHNVSTLVKGRERCVLQMHPSDAVARGIVDGSIVRVTSRVGALTVAVEITSDIRPATVSMPHGWGHGVAGTRQQVAARYAGVNSNVLSDEEQMDPLSGNAVLNAIPVTVEATLSTEAHSSSTGKSPRDS